jgi:hypothetical protein
MDTTGDELTLIGSDDRDTKFDFEAAAPGEVRVLHQTLSNGDESWNVEDPDPAGDAHMSVIIGRGSIAICHVVFVLGDDRIVAHGVLPVASGTGVGDGVLAVTGGNGKYEGARGRVEVAVVNPKKYHIIISSTGG